jgi:hypothetical protein
MFVHSTLLCWVVSFRDVLFREGLPYRHLHRKCRTIYLTAWGQKGRKEIMRVYWFAAGMFSLNHFISFFVRFWKKFERSRLKVWGKKLSLLQNVGDSTWIKTQDCVQWGTLLQISFVHYLLGCSTPTLECETLLTVFFKKICSQCYNNVFQQWHLFPLLQQCVPTMTPVMRVPSFHENTSRQIWMGPESVPHSR